METSRTELEEGKYTLVQHSDGRLTALRYGEEWRDLTGDKLVGALLSALTEAQEANQKLLQEPNQGTK